MEELEKKVIAALSAAVALVSEDSKMHGKAAFRFLEHSHLGSYGSAAKPLASCLTFGNGRGQKFFQQESLPSRPHRANDKITQTLRICNK